MSPLRAAALQLKKPLLAGLWQRAGDVVRGARLSLVLWRLAINHLGPNTLFGSLDNKPDELGRLRRVLPRHRAGRILRGGACHGPAQVHGECIHRPARSGTGRAAARTHHAPGAADRGRGNAVPRHRPAVRRAARGAHRCAGAGRGGGRHAAHRIALRIRRPPPGAGGVQPDGALPATESAHRRGTRGDQSAGAPLRHRLCHAGRRAAGVQHGPAPHVLARARCICVARIARSDMGEPVHAAGAGRVAAAVRLGRHQMDLYCRGRHDRASCRRRCRA